MANGSLTQTEDLGSCVCSSDKKPLQIDARMNMIACPDGRQLLMIMQTTKKDAGVYECVATNPLASVSSSCTISLARKPSTIGELAIYCMLSINIIQ